MKKMNEKAVTMKALIEQCKSAKLSVNWYDLSLLLVIREKSGFKIALFKVNSGGAWVA